uniref:MADS-box domain-containing protein n=1 Tax=Setaria italica TaxID=4555 RepID=K3Y1I3_SETIT
MAQSQTSFLERTNTLFSMAKDLSWEFGAHITVVAFFPTGEPKAYGAPTAGSVLCTYLPEIHRLSSPACSEMAGRLLLGALEVLRTDVQRHLDVMESSRKENMQS